jgi:hypothetical protein
VNGSDAAGLPAQSTSFAARPEAGVARGCRKSGRGVETAPVFAVP